MNAADAPVGEGAADVLAAAVALRWSRPDLTRLLSEHLLDRADALGDREAWLVAAGWRIHAVHSVGDGREVAADALGALQRWDDGTLHTAAAGRLRVELAGVAHDAGEPDVARRLLAPAVPAGDPELVADRATVLARLSQGDAGTAAEEAWSALGALREGVGIAGVQLVAAVHERREGRADKAIARAVAGLTRLDRSREAAGSPTPAGHLAAALAAEWIAALVDAGRWEQARDVIAGLAARLGERTRATRQLAYLRSTIARVLATDPDADAAEELERAARDAADADVPDLEHVCRVALGELYESRGQLEAALESIRLAVLAERRHRARAARLRSALATLAPAADPPERPAGTESAAVQHNAAQRTAVLRAVRPAAGARDGGPWATGSWEPGARPRATTGVERNGAPADRPVPSPVRRHRQAEQVDAPPPERPDAVRWDGRSSREDLLRPGGRVVLTSSTDPSSSAAADPWLAEALAELDRIVGRPADPPRPASDDRGASGDGCAVVLDLTDGTSPLPDAVAAPTLREVESRLADRLPPGARVRRDTRSSLIVIMPGSDGDAASAWMRGAVPVLADGLGAGDVSGALLRASLHGTDGVIGAQVLQRLGAPAPDRTSRFLQPGTEDEDRTRAESMRARSGRLAELGIGRGQRTAETPVPPEAPARGAKGALEDGSAPSGSGPSASGRRPYLPDGVVVRPGSGGRRHRRAEEETAAGPDSDADVPGADPLGPAAAPDRTGSVASGSAPAGSVPTSAADPTPAAPGSAAATRTAEARAAAANADPDPARPPVDGLGLADLLAGALAAYRRI